MIYSETDTNPRGIPRIRYAQIESGKGWPAMTTVVTDDASGKYSLLDGYEAVVFAASEGVYYYPLPASMLRHPSRRSHS